METNNCKCDLSKCNLDMTIRECLQKLGLDPKKAEKFLKDCCSKECCGE
jgi:hypothetical protein